MKKLEPWITLGTAFMKAGNFDQATKTFEKALDLAPESVPIILLLANCLLAKKESAKGAELLLRKADWLEPDQQDVWVHLGRALIAQGKLEEADEAFRHAIDINPVRATMLLPLFCPQPQIYEGEAGRRFVQQLTSYATTSEVD